MSLLCDRDLKRALKTGMLAVNPMPREIQPASIEVHLGQRFWMLLAGPAQGPINPFQDTADDWRGIEVDTFALAPGQFALGQTVEYICVGRELAARVDGKSTLGRYGLSVHCTAGFIDPGFEGVVTLELHNQGPRAIQLVAGMPIGQLVCERTTGPVERPYGAQDLGSHYQGSTWPVRPAPLDRGRILELHNG